MFTRESGSQQHVAEELGLPPAQTSRRWWIVAVAASALAIAGVATRLGQPKSLADAQRFRFARVTRDNLQVAVSASGKLEARNTVDVGAEISGRIVSVLVDFNERIEAGQLLALIDPEESEASFAEASAHLAEARAHIALAVATLTEARSAAARANVQASGGAISAEELERKVAVRDRAVAELSAARARAKVARAAQKSARTRRTRTRIVSPIDGIVLSRLVEPGQAISAGLSTPRLFRVAEDLRKMRLSVYVDESDIGSIKEGQRATFTVDTYPSRSFASRVKSLRSEPRADGEVVAYEAILEVDNDDLALRPGMTATATIVVAGRQKVQTVPNAALRFSPAQDHVHREDAGEASNGPRVWVMRDATLRPVFLRTGATDGERTELLDSTLAEGTAIVIEVVDPS